MEQQEISVEYIDHMGSDIPDVPTTSSMDDNDNPPEVLYDCPLHENATDNPLDGIVSTDSDGATRIDLATLNDQPLS